MVAEKLRYCAIDSHLAGEDRHPETVMAELLGDHAKVVYAMPIPIGDAWWFWIERETPLPDLPDYVTDLVWDDPKEWAPQ